MTSWDEGKGDVDYNYEDGRSYISAVSEVIHDESETCAGAAKVGNRRGETRAVARHPALCAFSLLFRFFCTEGAGERTWVLTDASREGKKQQQIWSQQIKSWLTRMMVGYTLIENKKQFKSSPKKM